MSKEIKYKHGSSTELAYDWHYVLKKSKYNKLNYDSAVQCEDIRCVSKSRMGKFITKVSPEDMNEIKKSLIAKVNSSAGVNSTALSNLLSFSIF